MIGAAMESGDVLHLIESVVLIFVAAFCLYAIVYRACRKAIRDERQAHGNGGHETR